MKYIKMRHLTVLFFFLCLHLLAQGTQVSPGEAAIAQESKFGETSFGESTPLSTEAPVQETVSLDPRLQKVLTDATLFFQFEINLLSDTRLEDLGVNDKKFIHNAVIDAWKNWSKKDLSEYQNVETYDELDFKSAKHHPKNVLILFKANVRKIPRIGVSQRIDLEVSAEYVVLQLSTKKVLSSFDFPYIQRTFDAKDNKTLSSAVASLFYNLLNAKGAEIVTNIKGQNLDSIDTKEFEYGIRGAKSLIEINRLSILVREASEKTKTLCTFSSKVISFALTDGKIHFLSGCNDTNLSEALKSLGVIELSKGRGFHFLPDQKTFEIFDVPLDNSIKKEMPTP